MPHRGDDAAWLNVSNHATSVLYSFRRCPYAIRARLALAAAGLKAGSDLEVREVNLKAKPAELLETSAKATVPVLVLATATGVPQVLDESLTIAAWALHGRDQQGWLAGWRAGDRAVMQSLIAENDGPFKRHLDRFKYPERFGLRGSEQEHRQRALAILRGWSDRLAHGDWLLGERASLADWSLLPFVRQFRLADPTGFAAALQLGPLQAWLARFEAGSELAAVMAPPWARRQPWASPRWVYHLALASEWRQARVDGVYERSTRGRSLQEVGFIHTCQAHQIAATHARWFADSASDGAPDGVVLLCIDPQPLGEALRLEPVSPSGELFPHLYGPLPLAAVVAAHPYRPEQAHGMGPPG